MQEKKEKYYIVNENRKIATCKRMKNLNLGKDRVNLQRKCKLIQENKSGGIYLVYR